MQAELPPRYCQSILRSRVLITLSRLLCDLSQHPPILIWAVTCGFFASLSYCVRSYILTSPSMCVYSITHFACGHNSGLQYVHGCQKSWEQFMRIYNPRERGQCFDWPDQCIPQSRNNVTEYHHWGACGRCQIPGWRFDGVMRDRWS